MGDDVDDLQDDDEEEERDSEPQRHRNEVSLFAKGILQVRRVILFRSS